MHDLAQINEHDCDISGDNLTLASCPVLRKSLLPHRLNFDTEWCKTPITTGVFE